MNKNTFQIGQIINQIEQTTGETIHRGAFASFVNRRAELFSGVKRTGGGNKRWYTVNDARLIAALWSLKNRVPRTPPESVDQIVDALHAGLPETVVVSGETSVVVDLKQQQIIEGLV